MFSYLHEIRWSVGFEALKCEMLGRVALEARLSESRFTTRHMRRLVACWSIRRECATSMIRLEFWPDKSADIQISTNISGTPCMDSIKTSVLFFVLTRKKNSSFYYKMRKHRGLMEKKKWSTSETWASFFFSCWHFSHECTWSEDSIASSLRRKMRRWRRKGRLIPRCPLVHI